MNNRALSQLLAIAALAGYKGKGKQKNAKIESYEERMRKRIEAAKSRAEELLKVGDVK